MPKIFKRRAQAVLLRKKRILREKKRQEEKEKKEDAKYMKEVNKVTEKREEKIKRGNTKPCDDKLTRIEDMNGDPTDLYLYCVEKPPSEQEIAAFESKIGIELPPDLRHFILKYNGGDMASGTLGQVIAGRETFSELVSRFSSWKEISQQNQEMHGSLDEPTFHEMKFNIPEDAVYLDMYEFKLYVFLRDVVTEAQTIKRGEIWDIDFGGYGATKYQNSFSDLIHAKWIYP